MTKRNRNGSSSYDISSIHYRQSRAGEREPPRFQTDPIFGPVGAATSKNTYDFLVNNEGYGLPASRRLPYADYGLALAQAVTASPAPQTLQTASYGANRLGLAAGQFAFLDPGGANEEYERIISADPDNQTFDAIVTKDHAAGERIRPTAWPTPILHEGDDLAFDILSVASPDTGSDLSVVIQT